MLVNFLYQLLKSPAGKFSRKSFMMIVTFFITMNIGVGIVIADLVFNKEAHTVTTGVFDSLLFFLIGLLAGTITDKKLTSKNVEKPKNEEDGSEI